jgi:hypothetical protein
MVPTCQNSDFVLEDFIHQTMLRIDPSRPTTGQVVLERLWLPNAMKRITLHIADESDDA